MYLVNILETARVLITFQTLMYLFIVKESSGGELNLLRMLRPACLKYAELQD